MKKLNKLLLMGAALFGALSPNGNQTNACLNFQMTGEKGLGRKSEEAYNKLKPENLLTNPHARFIKNLEQETNKITEKMYMKVNVEVPTDVYSGYKLPFLAYFDALSAVQAACKLPIIKATLKERKTRKAKMLDVCVLNQNRLAKDTPVDGEPGTMTITTGKTHADWIQIYPNGIVKSSYKGHGSKIEWTGGTSQDLYRARYNRQRAPENGKRANVSAEDLALNSVNTTLHEMGHMVMNELYEKYLENAKKLNVTIVMPQWMFIMGFYNGAMNTIPDKTPHDGPNLWSNISKYSESGGLVEKFAEDFTDASTSTTRRSRAFEDALTKFANNILGTKMEKCLTPVENQ